MANNTFDAIVIGSGISGGWAAKELTENGLKTIMLERGRNIEHVKDYTNALKAPWQFEHRGGRTYQMTKDYPVLGREYFLNETNLDYWASDKDSPYTEIKRFDWFRGYHVGGRSLMWGRQSYRWSDLDFEANLKDGVGVDWPIRYKDLAPWYSHVEKHAGISGSSEGLHQLPDGEFLPPMDMNVAERAVADKINSHYAGKRKMIIGRTANLTKALPGRSHCNYRNKCALGCPFGAYFSTQSSTLPAAMATGNLTVRPYSIVTRILYDKDKKKATGVEVLDAQTNKTYEYYAKVIFLNASTLNSAWVLMNSATDVWPDGLGSSSGELGHNLMDHHMRAGAFATVEGFDDRYYFGRRPNGIYVPRYRNVDGDKRDYIRGFGYQGIASREGWGREIPEMQIGGAYKDALGEPGKWVFGMAAFGEMLPDHNNKVTLDKNKKDKWGLPVLAMDVQHGENERKMRVDMVNDAIEMLTVAGLKDVAKFESESYPGAAIHEMGTARMGRDPKTSVLNEWNQVWDAKNVFVTDGAAMASTACQNPSLTYMALTTRAANYAAAELKKGTLV
ncbi:MAG: GMC oxidoreductase [Mucilaginibacter sp.]